MEDGQADRGQSDRNCRSLASADECSFCRHWRVCVREGQDNRGDRQVGQALGKQPDAPIDPIFAGWRRESRDEGADQRSSHDRDRYVGAKGTEVVEAGGPAGETANAPGSDQDLDEASSHEPASRRRKARLSILKDRWCIGRDNVQPPVSHRAQHKRGEQDGDGRPECGDVLGRHLVCKANPGAQVTNRAEERDLCRQVDYQWQLPASCPPDFAG